MIVILPILISQTAPMEVGEVSCRFLTWHYHLEATEDITLLFIQDIVRMDTILMVIIITTLMVTHLIMVHLTDILPTMVGIIQITFIRTTTIILIPKKKTEEFINTETQQTELQITDTVHDLI